MPWFSKINFETLSSDQWIARELSAAGLLVAAVARGLRFGHPISATFLLMIGSLVFILALWIAARNRVRWLDSAAIILCLASLALCSYRVTQQLRNAHPPTANSAESANPNDDPDSQ